MYNRVVKKLKTKRNKYYVQKEKKEYFGKSNITYLLKLIYKVIFSNYEIYNYFFNYYMI